MIPTALLDAITASPVWAIFALLLALYVVERIREAQRKRNGGDRVTRALEQLVKLVGRQNEDLSAHRRRLEATMDSQPRRYREMIVREFPPEDWRTLIRGFNQIHQGQEDVKDGLRGVKESLDRGLHCPMRKKEEG